MKRRVAMLTRIHQIPPHIHQIHLHLLERPPKTPRKGPHGDAVQRVEHHAPVVQPNHLHLGVPRPHADGHLEGRLGDVDEAGVEDLLPVVPHGEEVDAELFEGADHGLEEVLELVVCADGAVVALYLELEVLELDPAAWL